MMQGHSMMEGVMMGGPGMMVFGVFYLLALVFVIWLFYRLVRATEKIAENTEEK